MKHSQDGKVLMLPMQPCRMKKVANSVSTLGESMEDGTGRTVVASGQAGMAVTATRQGNWPQVEIVDNITTRMHTVPVTDTPQRGSNVSRKRLPNIQNPVGRKTIGKTVKKNFPKHETATRRFGNLRENR